MSRHRWLFLALLALLLLSSCELQTSHSPPDPIPILCHKELGVGILFITIANHGSDSPSSTMIVKFYTNSSQKRQVQLQVEIPGIPSGSNIWVPVNLPAGSQGFLKPVGKITIIINSAKVLAQSARGNNVLITGCNDLT